MTEVDLKKRLITRIKSLKNPLLLEEVSRLIESGDEKEDIYVLSDQQKKEIEEAQKQYNKGHFLSNKDADKETDQWLEE
ncbi:MAG: hypothetical protein ACOC1D_01175 [Prolixibacteraceae bacterium]